MKVTAFHVVRKIEEAALEYFSNSSLFNAREIVTSRVVDFRRGTAGIQFFFQESGDCLGGLEVETVQENEEKIAFQCRYTIKPAGDQGQSFFMSRTNREPHDWYPKLMEKLTRSWEANASSYAGDPAALEESAPAMSTAGVKEAAH